VSGAKGGKPAIFGPKPKDSKYRRVGLISKPGGAAFEYCRKALARCYRRATGRPWKGQPSDGDTFEYMAVSLSALLKEDPAVRDWAPRADAAAEDAIRDKMSG
jgi:hypothetical protein